MKLLIVGHRSKPHSFRTNLMISQLREVYPDIQITYFNGEKLSPKSGKTCDPPEPEVWFDEAVSYTEEQLNAIHKVFENQYANKTCRNNRSSFKTW